MKVNIKSIAPHGPDGHVVLGEVDGEEHQIFRRTQMPVSGGTSTPPHVIVREFADDYVLYQEAGAELEKAGEEGDGYPFSNAGSKALKVKFSEVNVIGPNLVEVKGSVDGQEKTALVDGDFFKQKYHEAIALDQPNFFVGAISTKLTEDKSVRGLEDYIGEFEIQESPQKAQIVDSKNFAQPHFSQHPLTKSKAQTAKANWESPKQVTGGGEEKASSEFNGMKSSSDDGGILASNVTTAHFESDQGTGHAGVDKRTPEEDAARDQNPENPHETNKSAAMEPDR
jgi:hypothetical protein